MKNRHFLLRVILEQFSLIIAYALLLLLGWSLVKLHEPTKWLIFDLLRFSWPPLVFWLGWRVYRAYRSQRYLQEAQQNKQLPVKRPPTALAASYFQALRQNEQQQRQLHQQQQLQAAQRMDYLQLWSHEIKLPLTALKLAAENTTQVNSEEVVTQLGLIQNQLDLLLNYERLADFHHDLTFEEFSLRTLLEDLLKENAIFFIDKQLKPQINMNKEIKVVLDRKWLRFCLQQVIFNAIKYSSPKGKLLISWQTDTLLIQDFGCGINSADLPRVFEPGFTGENGRKQQAATGMGLYLVKQVTEKLGVKFKLESVAGQGTSAYFIFPATLINNNL